MFPPVRNPLSAPLLSAVWNSLSAVWNSLSAVWNSLSAVRSFAVRCFRTPCPLSAPLLSAPSLSAALEPPKIYPVSRYKPFEGLKPNSHLPANNGLSKKVNPPRGVGVHLSPRTRIAAALCGLCPVARAQYPVPRTPEFRPLFSTGRSAVCCSTVPITTGRFLLDRPAAPAEPDGRLGAIRPKSGHRIGVFPWQMTVSAP
jgi:hypothetical protein